MINETQPAIPELAALSLPEKIGQMLCLGWQGQDALLQVNAQAERGLTELHAGGMILFARNVQAAGAAVEPERVRAMLADLSATAKIPPFVAVDQEGGRVARFGAPFSVFPNARQVGTIADIALVETAARAIGEELRAVGVDFNFAPVADIDSNPANPVIGARSFGTTPELVARMVTAQVRGYEAAGVLPCAKHFPGHGDTDVDSHHALPTLPHDMAVMQARELVPFQAAIAAGIPAIMTAHILFPALDPSSLPATLSRPILTGLLRDTLGFAGMIVTDCLEMKAISNGWGTARSAVLAAQAGADLLLVCHTWERQKAAFDALLAAVESGELSEARVDDAVARILALKRRLHASAPLPLDTIGSAQHQAIARAVHEAAGISVAPPTALPTLGESAPD